VILHLLLFSNAHTLLTHAYWFYCVYTALHEQTAASEQQRLAALLSSNLLVRRTELRERLDPEHGGVGSSAVAAAAAARQEALTVKQAQLAAVLRAVDDNRDRLNQIESELLERRQVGYCIATLLLLLLVLLLLV
jgi:hypothetical protein